MEPSDNDMGGAKLSAWLGLENKVFYNQVRYAALTVSAIDENN